MTRLGQNHLARDLALVAVREVASAWGLSYAWVARDRDAAANNDGIVLMAVAGTALVAVVPWDREDPCESADALVGWMGHLCDLGPQEEA